MEMEKEIKILNIDDVLPNRFQPRITFKDEKINELADSIKEHGVIQPITVRKVSDKYEIITGERRYKASIIAGKKTIPAIVTNLNDEDSAEIALIENVQRQDLTPIEEAISYKKILDMGYLNQSALAEKLGKTQSTIANKLRLLNLTDEVQEALLQERISERHARSLLKLHAKEQKEMLNRIIKERLTVRKTDEEIIKILSGTKKEVEISEIKKESEQIENKVLEVHPVFNSNPVNNFNNVQQFNNKLQIEENNDIEILDFLSDNNEEKGEIDNMNNNFNSFNIPNDPIIEPKEEPITFGNPVVNNNQEQPVQFEEPKEIVQTFDSFNSVVNNQESPSIFINNNQSVNNNESTKISDMGETPKIEEKEEGPKFFTMFKPEIENNYVEDMEQDSANMSFNKEDQQPKSVFDFTPINLEPEKEEKQEEFNPFTNNSSNENINKSEEEFLQNQNFQNNNNFDIFNTTTNIVENNINENKNIIEEKQEELSFMNQMKPYTLNDEAQFTPMSNVEMQSSNPFENQYQYKTEVELQPLMQEENKPIIVDFKTVINTIRDCSNTIEKYGYTIDTEELDFEDSYQVIFKINKK